MRGDRALQRGIPEMNQASVSKLIQLDAQLDGGRLRHRTRYDALVKVRLSKSVEPASGLTLSPTRDVAKDSLENLRRRVSASIASSSFPKKEVLDW